MPLRIWGRCGTKKDMLLGECTPLTPTQKWLNVGPRKPGASASERGTRGCAAGSDSGSAYVFREVSGGWQQVAKLTPDDGVGGDYFGESVSLSGDTAVVGANRDDDAGTDSGSAYIFREIDGIWQLVAKLTPDDGAAEDYFGLSVSLSGDTGVVGAYSDDDAGSSSGSAYVFGTCPADINADGQLNILDFVAFQLLFVAADPAADCDHNGELNILDFVCYQALFQAGCS
jgi:hypothetical protein